MVGAPSPFNPEYDGIASRLSIFVDRHGAITKLGGTVDYIIEQVIELRTRIAHSETSHIETLVRLIGIPGQFVPVPATLLDAILRLPSITGLSMVSSKLMGMGAGIDMCCAGLTRLELDGSDVEWTVLEKLLSGHKIEVFRLVAAVGLVESAGLAKTFWNLRFVEFNNETFGYGAAWVSCDIAVSAEWWIC